MLLALAAALAWMSHQPPAATPVLPAISRFRSPPGETSRLALAAGPPPPAPALRADSLEEFLRRAREKRAERLAALRAPVGEIVARLEERGRPGPERQMAAIRAELDALGVEAAPLLLPHLDPGPTPSPAAAFRAAEIAETLIRMRTASITASLIDFFPTASRPGQRNVVKILGQAPDRARASAFLTELFRAEGAALRQECVIALAQLGGPENALVLREALTDANPSVVEAVLAALAANTTVEALEAVRELVRDPSRASPVVLAILAYYAQCGAAVVQDAKVEVARLAAGESGIGKAERLAILAALPALAPERDRALAEALAPLLESRDDELWDAARVALALLGDRGARGELRRKYDELVRTQEAWNGAYERRAAILLRLGEYADAAKDYERAIGISMTRRQTTDQTLYVGLARAHALDGRLKPAYEALMHAYLTPKQRQELAADPDFAALAAHARYGKIFE
ncbi:MAG: tetratricopeptide repeat protein [Planctomycetota bacterium]